MRRHLLDRLVIVVCGETEATVAAPYRACPLIKDLRRGSRRWDRGRGLWVVTLDVVDLLVRGLTIFGFEVDVWRDGSYATHTPLKREQFGGAA